MLNLSNEVSISIEVGVELFKDLIFKSYQAVASLAKEKSREYDLFGQATQRYIGGLIRRYNEVQVLGMREPVPLKSLYVRANILEKITARMGLLRPEDLAEFFDFDRRTFGKSRETVDGEIIVNKLQKFIVLGKPGAGKTTYLKYLTLMMLDPHSQIEQRKLPVFITLREWADTGLQLLDFIAQQFDICGFAQAGTFVERMLRDGQCLVLFDGLDEVSELVKQDDIIRQIKDFSDKYYDNQFIISCRVAAYNHWFSGFTEIEMADFNEEQMENFIKNWFRGEPKVADECWERLKGSAPLKELASVPLLLTLLCMTYTPEKGFPEKRSLIYKEAIRQLLEDWDEKRAGGRVKRDSFYKNLSVELKEEMLAEIGWRTFNHDKYFIAEDDLARMIEVFLKQQPEFASIPRISGRKILKEIEAHHSLLVERATGVYSFAHLTFQEYFAARYVSNNSLGGSLETLVDEHLYKDKWKEVFLLIAEILNDVDELALLIQRKIQPLKEDEDVSKFLFEAEQIFASDKNTLALLYIMSEMLKPEEGRPISFEEARRMLSEMTEEEKKQMEEAGSIGQNQDETHGKLSDLYELIDTHLYQGSDSSFEYYPDLIDEFRKSFVWKDRNWRTLYYFFKSNIFIIKIIQSANFVSKPIREKILNEMFLPKPN